MIRELQNLSGKEFIERRDLRVDSIDAILRPEEAYHNNPVEWLDDLLLKIIGLLGTHVDTKAIAEWNFNAVKNLYSFRYYTFSEVVERFHAENNLFGKILNRTPITWLWKDHANLTSAYQCDYCGTITINDDSCDGANLRSVCPTCNDVSKMFTFIKKSDKESWTNHMLWSEVVKDSEYFRSEYNKCKFKPTKKEILFYKLKNRIRNYFKLK